MIASMFLAFVAIGIALGVLFVGYGGVFLMIIGLCVCWAAVSFLATNIARSDAPSEELTS